MATPDKLKKMKSIAIMALLGANSHNPISAEKLHFEISGSQLGNQEQMWMAELLQADNSEEAKEEADAEAEVKKDAKKSEKEDDGAEKKEKKAKSAAAKKAEADEAAANFKKDVAELSDKAATKKAAKDVKHYEKAVAQQTLLTDSG